MLGAPQREICSIAYHSTESFEARRKMVTSIAREFFKSLDKKQEAHANTEWNEIDKLLKDGSENRNKLAHYVLDFDLIKEPEKPGDTNCHIRSANPIAWQRWNSSRWRRPISACFCSSGDSFSHSGSDMVHRPDVDAAGASGCGFNWQRRTVTDSRAASSRHAKGENNNTGGNAVDDRIRHCAARLVFLALARRGLAQLVASTSSPWRATPAGSLRYWFRLCRAGAHLSAHRYRRACRRTSGSRRRR
jgi:hypothetical protein